MVFTFIRTTCGTAALVGLLGLAGCSRSTSQPAATATTGTSAGHASATPSAEGELRTMSVDDLASMLTRSEPVTVIDNNGRERYEQGHIPGARWVGHDAVTAAVLPQARDARLVFYCYNEH
jgi:hypothetical protein